MDYYQLVWYTVYLTIMIPTVIGNGLVIISVIRYEKLRNNINVLICNLAVSDFIVGAIVVPFNMAADFYQLKTNEYVCLTSLATLVVSLGSSSYNLLLISIERFIAIVYPLRSQSFLTRHKLAVAVTLGWTVTVVNASIPLYGFNSVTNATEHCWVEAVWTKAYRVNTDWQLTFALGVNFVFYTIVVITALRKGNRETNVVGSHLNIHTRAKKDLHHLVTMVIVLGTFMLCWLPYVVMAVIVTFYDMPQYQYVKRCTVLPGLFNSAMNWIIYAYRKPDLKRAFSHVLLCRPRHQMNRRSSRSSAIITSTRLSSIAA